MLLYDNYVEKMGIRKTQVAREVGLFFGVNDKTVRLWRLMRFLLCNAVVKKYLVMKVCEIPGDPALTKIIVTEH